MTFQAPDFLFLLIFLPAAVALYSFYRKKQKQETLNFSSIKTLKQIGGEIKSWRRHGSFILELFIFLALITALARPKAVLPLPSNQIAAAILFDTSGSMMAQDVFPSRIGAAKQAAEHFIKHESESYPVGIITFSTYPLVRLNPTTNKQKILSAISSVHAHLGGTAIGDAIFSAMSLLDGYPEAHKVILLFSDGGNNAGSSPTIAAKAANEQGIRIYAFGVGTKKGTYMPGIPIKVNLQEKTLKKISKLSGGKYYKISNVIALKKILSKLSKKIKIVKKYQDIAWYFAAAGLLLLAVKMLLDFTLFRRIP
jgi:Ca-activated chloride channel family protein